MAIAASSTTPAFAQAGEEQPIVVTPHPQAGKFKLQHDADRPLLSFYGGVGLRKLPDGRWTGYGQTSPADVEYLIRRCAENGMKRIYGSFQEERYPSELAPAEAGTSDVDYVALCIKLAHENNIQVYADQPTFAFVIERNSAFVRQHPHYFTRSVTGETDTHMLSAAFPEVRRFKRSLFMEWVKNYPVDGIQLDFIRFPYYTMDLRVGYGKHGYDEPALKGFRERYGLPENEMPAVDDMRWVKFKADFVSQFIRELRADFKASGIDLPIGVYNSAHFGRGDSLRTVHQDWQTWEREALVDEHSPMFYMSNGMANLIGALKSLAAVKRPESRIIGPIFLSEGYAPGERPTPDEVRDTARRLIKLGCDELWFCRASEIEEFDLWPVVKEISQWSIKEIRAQDFDPAYENLLKNGGFAKGTDAWTASPPNAATHVSPASETERAAVRVAATDGRPASLSQSLRFRPLRHIPLDSLSVSAQVRSPGPAAATRANALVRIHYKNGETDEHRVELRDLTDQWQHVQFDVKARTDFATLLASKADLSFEVSAGTLELADVEVQRDQLIERDGKSAE